MTKTINGKEEVPSRPLKEKVSVSLDKDVECEIRKLALADQRSFSQYINRVLRKHIREYEE